LRPNREHRSSLFSYEGYYKGVLFESTSHISVQPLEVKNAFASNEAAQLQDGHRLGKYPGRFGGAAGSAATWTGSRVGTRCVLRDCSPPRRRQFHCGSSDGRIVYSYLLGIAKTSDARITRRYTPYCPFLSPAKLVPTSSRRKRVKTKQSVSDGRVARCDTSRLASSPACSHVESAIWTRG
jgi:hypothetical protein